jgi:hypothetical protein
MDVDAVAHNLCGNLLAPENRSSQSGLAVIDRRHPIEEMRGLPRARSMPARASS